MDKLAIRGGRPCIGEALPTKLLGVSLLGKEERQELNDVIEQKALFRHYGIGTPTKVEHFEEMASQWFSGAFTLAVSSGTAALFCAMAAIGLNPGDEVIIPTLLWHSDYACIVNSGATPVFAGIDETLNLAPAGFEAKITPKTKAVIVVHYQGAAAHLEAILAIAKKHGIIVIEDIAQAFGGTYKGKAVGTFGDIAVASFQSSKMITSGEGGLFITSNQRYYARAVRYHDLGLLRDVFARRITDQSLHGDAPAFPGQQYRMGELAGAVIGAQFAKLDLILDTCRRLHVRICEELKECSHFTIRPTEHGDCGITLFLLFETGGSSQQFATALEAEGVPIGPSSYCINMLNLDYVRNRTSPFPHMPPFAKGAPGEGVRYDDEALCATTDAILERYLAIGIGPSYTDKNVTDIIAAIKKVDAQLWA